MEACKFKNIMAIADAINLDYILPSLVGEDFISPEEFCLLQEKQDPKEQKMAFLGIIENKGLLEQLKKALKDTNQDKVLKLLEGK